MSWLTEPDSEWDAPDDPSNRTGERRSRLRLVALLLAGWLVVSVLVLLILLAVGGRHSTDRAAGSAANTPVATSSAQPSASSTSGSATLPDGWTRRASDSQTDCAAHSYGQVQSFFARTPCTSVQRLLATTSRSGRAVVIASSVVSFRTPAQAEQYLGLVNTDGTGNIADLLREGASYPGAPQQLPDAAYASRLDGNRVLVAEAGYVGGTSSASDPVLREIAEEGVR